MPLQPITNNMSGEDAANIILTNDEFLAALMASDYVSKEGFDAAMAVEVAGKSVTEDLGALDNGTTPSVFGTQYHWTYPLSISHVLGTIDRVRVYLVGAAPVTVVVGKGSFTSGGFTERAVLGTFDGVAGLNTFVIANAPIDSGEIVAIKSNSTTNINFGSNTSKNSSWIRQTATGITDSSAGWIPYDYRVTGLTRSALYDVFAQKKDFIAKDGFDEALATELATIAPVTRVVGITVNGGFNTPVSSGAYHWTTPQSTATVAGNVKALNVRLQTAGRIRFMIGTLNAGGGYTERISLGEFDVVAGLSVITLPVPIAINAGETIGFRGTTGTTAVVIFGGGTSQNSRWNRGSATALGDSSNGWWCVSADVESMQPSVLFDYFVAVRSIGDRMAAYLRDGQQGTSVTVGIGTAATGTIGTGSTGYYGNPAIFPSDGRIDTIRVNAAVAGAQIFAIGNIDQFGIFLEERTFSRTLSIGINSLTQLVQTVKKGQVLLLKNPPASINRASSVGTSYVFTATAGTAMTTVNDFYISYNIDMTPIAAPVVASVAELTALTVRVDTLSTRNAVIFSTPSNFEYKLICDDNGSNIRAVSPFPNKGVSIGNSITTHGITSFWWGVWGMAASARAKDYVHQLGTLMKAKNPAFTNLGFGNAGWETGHVGYDYTQWDAFLALDTDLVTLILGDNTQDTSGFANSCIQMLQYVRARLPLARIVITDNWYYSQVKRDAIEAAAKVVSNVKFIRIATLRNSSTEAGMGTVVMGDDGQQHTIDNSGVATHPGDAGHLAIAQTLLSVAY